MKIQNFVYHENNLEKTFIPQEDYYESYENIFVVADGITHDVDNGFYPNPSDSAEVAKIVCNTFIRELKSTTRELEDIKNSIPKVNEAVQKFNSASNLYKNREDNGYTIGSAVFSIIIIKESKLIYAVLDDCFFSIFSNDLIDHPTLKSFVELSAKYYDAHYDWNKPNDRKVWRKDYRNHELNFYGQTLGYGAIDGRAGFEKYIQYGEEKLVNGDLICLYTDGFIKIMKDTEFIRKLKDTEFSMETLQFISKYTKDKNIAKEKTCYFIKYLN